MSTSPSQETLDIFYPYYILFYNHSNSFPYTFWEVYPFRPTIFESLVSPPSHKKPNSGKMTSQWVTPNFANRPLCTAENRVNCKRHSKGNRTGLTPPFAIPVNFPSSTQVIGYPGAIWYKLTLSSISNISVNATADFDTKVSLWMDPYGLPLIENEGTNAEFLWNDVISPGLFYIAVGAAGTWVYSDDRKITNTTNPDINLSGITLNVSAGPPPPPP